MSQKYYTLLTTKGAALLANATALGTQLKLTQMAVGDGNGSIPQPVATQTKLIHEVRRAAINTVFIDKNNPNQIIVEQVIPETEGGWFIHEIGLYDDKGNLIAVGNCPSTYKPQLVEGSGRTQVIRMILIINNTDAVQLKIDPAVVLATREYVDDLIATKMAAHEKSTNHPSATTKSKGFVQLSSLTDSESEVLAATPKAVKATYDLAAGAVKKSGDTMKGPLTINVDNYGLTLENTMGRKWLSRIHNDNSYSISQYDSETNAYAFKFRYVGSNKVWRFEGCDDVTINGTSILKKGDAIQNALFIEGDDAGLTLKNAAGGLWRYKIYPNGDNGLILYDKTKWIVKSYYSQAQKEHRFLDTDSVTINGTPVLKQGDGGLFGKAPLLAPGTDFLTDDVLSASQTFTLAGSYVNTPNDTKIYTSSLEVIRRCYDAGAAVTLRLNQGGNVFYIATATKTSEEWVSSGWVEQLTSKNINNYLPVGIPQPWPKAAVPSGWLKCNGSTFDKILYPKLATAYPTGALPDLRGEFIRGFDDGRGVDSGRTTLSAQGDAMRNIAGNMAMTNGHTREEIYTDGAFTVTSKYDGAQNGTAGKMWVSTVRFDASRSVPTANEFRPRNIAFLYIVKAE